jgi:hypothetical protein
MLKVKRVMMIRDLCKMYNFVRIEKCYYCGGNCPNEPKDSEFLCDSYAGDIDDLYKNEQASEQKG